MQQKTLSHKLYLKNKIENYILKVEAKNKGASFAEVHPALYAEIEQAMDDNNTPKLQLVLDKLERLI
jgi:hypothetical protein